MKYIFILFSILSFSQNNKIITIDDETLEFIDEVKYTLFLNNKGIYTNLTSRDTITFLPYNVVFDSISFYKINYKEYGVRKDSLKEVILLSKVIYELDEIVVVNSKQKEIFIGEKSRFIKKRSNIITENIDYGIIFRENEFNNMEVKKLLFYVEKVKLKTTYKLKFFEAEEIGNPIITQTIKIGKLFFESPILTLEQGTKDKIEIYLNDYNIDFSNKNIFITIELQNYFDESNTIINPENKNKTKLKYQISNKTNYYSKMADYYTNEPTIDLFNINQMINYDFATKFFKKPHKSILIAPAILLVAKSSN